MAKSLYKARIEHNEHTIELLYKAEYFAFEKLRVLLRLAAGVAAVAAALLLSLPIWMKGMLLLIGAWLAVSLDFQSQVRADKALQERKAALPVMEYEFHESMFHLSGEGSMDIRYANLIHLTEDNGYFYLFLSKSSVCMIDKNTIKPYDVIAFKKFIEKKTGKQFVRDTSLLLINFYDILDMFKLRRKK